MRGHYSFIMAGQAVGRRCYCVVHDIYSFRPAENRPSLVVVYWQLVYKAVFLNKVHTLLSVVVPIVLILAIVAVVKDGRTNEK
jgi:hypothetical protein